MIYYHLFRTQSFPWDFYSEERLPESNVTRSNWFTTKGNLVEMNVEAKTPGKTSKQDKQIKVPSAMFLSEMNRSPYNWLCSVNKYTRFVKQNINLFFPHPLYRQDDESGVEEERE